MKGVLLELYSTTLVKPKLEKTCVIAKHLTEKCIFANEGNDITSPADIHTSLKTYGGVRGSFQTVVAIDNSKEPEVNIKIPVIGQLNNFEFSDEGIVVRKAYKIGQRRLIKNNDLSNTVLSELSGMLVSIDYHFTIHSLLM